MKPSKRITEKKITALLLSGSLMLSVLSGCSVPTGFHTAASTENSSTEINQSFDDFLMETFRTEVVTNTISLHYTLSNPAAYGITDYNITLGTYTDESIAADYAETENLLNRLTSFDYDSLSLDQQLTYDIFKDYLSSSLATADLYLYAEPLRPTTGIQSQLPILYEEYRFYSEQDIKDYLALIALTDEYLAQMITFEQEKAAAGLFMSDFACNTIIEQCDSFVSSPDSHYLIETFNNKLDNFPDLSDADRDAYKIENETLVKEEILPAYEHLSAALAELSGSGTNEGGLCNLEEGTRYYESLVYANTGCSASIEEIKQMISDQRTKDLQEAADLSKDDPEIWEKCNDVTLSNSDSTTTLNMLKEAMLTEFPAAPDTTFTVNYIDECMEDFLAPAYYVTAPIDDYSSNSIYINASTDTSDITYATTLAHEGYPGHLYQTVMSYDAGIAPVRSLLNYSGYIEGWATYVEMMSYHYLGLDEDVATMLELNQSALLSLYATTDIGIHYDGWTFDDMLEFWGQYGVGDEETLRYYYELIVEEPSHYLKYYVGYLGFLDLKEKAQHKYLLRFDEVAFHQAVLDIGPAPFTIVETYLDDFYSTH